MSLRNYLFALATENRTNLSDRIVQLFLLLLSWIYAGAIWGREGLYRLGVSRVLTLPRPVISVGNITLGGVGKTPLTALLAERCFLLGSRPAVLLRGYMPGREAKVPSDEAAMLGEQLRDKADIVVGKDRYSGAMRLLQNQAVDVFLLDDGFQHWRVRRDLNIVAVDARNPFGNGHLLPRGTLREPLSALRRADLIVLTKVDQAVSGLMGLEEKIQRFNPGVPVLLAVHEPVELSCLRSGEKRPLSSLSGREVCSVCSIGDPAAFESTLSALGAKVRTGMRFPDHHNYVAEDFVAIDKDCRGAGITTLVTTHKDAVKLGQGERFPVGVEVLVLRVVLKIIRGGEILDERMDRLFCR